MPGFLVVVIVLFLVGTVMWVKPSPRDRDLNRLRSQALRDGFKLETLRVPDTSEEGRVSGRQHLRTLYRLRHVFDNRNPPFFTVLRTTGVAGGHLPEGWTWGDDHRADERHRAPLADWLEGLPERFDLVDARPDGIGLVWDERGGPSELPAIRETLERLVAILSA